jgi:hypothetical protein
LNRLEQQLLRDTVGNSSPRFILRTRTRVDTGRWTRRSPLWLCIMEDEIVLLSVGRRRYLQRRPLEDCRESHYNAARGGLVIAPGDGLRFPCLEMPVADALKALDFIHSTHETKQRC